MPNILVDSLSKKFNGLTAVAALLLVLTLAAYSNSFHGEYHFDDYHQIRMNPYIRDIGNIPRYFTDAGIVSFNVGFRLYRPMTLSSFALNYAFSGYDTFGFHVFNFAVHFLNSLLVYLVVSGLLRLSSHGKPFPAALFASLVFALHPIQTGAVDYITGRSALLVTFFYLLAFYCFMHFRTEGGKSRYAWGALVPLLYLMGLLSKEMAVSLPAVMLTYDLIFTRPGDPARGRAGTWLYYAAFAAVLAFYLYLKKTLQVTFTEQQGAVRVIDYLSTELRILLMYARLLVFPVNQNADYNLPFMAVWYNWLSVLAALLSGLSVYMLYRLRAVYPVVAFFGLWFFITWAPESSLVPIADLAVEYRLYLPSVGFLAAAVVALYGATSFPPAAKKAAACTLLLLFCILTFCRNKVWATEYSLWDDAFRKAPYSARAFLNLEMARVQHKRYAEAVAGLTKLNDPVLSMNAHGRSILHNQAGFAMMEMGDLTGALREFEIAVREDPSEISPHENRGLVLLKLGRYAESAEAFLKVIGINPNYSEPHTNLSMVYNMMKRDEDSLREAREAVRIEPLDFSAKYNLATSLYNSGMKAEAYRQARETLRLADGGDQVKKAEALVVSVQQ